MRVEPSEVGSIIHVIKRGARGMEIVRDEFDRQRFATLLFLLNDTYFDASRNTSIGQGSSFERPKHWPERQPLTRILAWTLMTNHFHILLQEINKGGTAKFMQRLGGSMTMCFNIKYKERGSIFQGAYKARVVQKDEHLRYLIFYILVKNVLELYPGGLLTASKNFDDAWAWALSYRFSSLPDYVLKTHSKIINDADGLVSDILGDNVEKFKAETYEMLLSYMTSHGDDFEGIMLEKW